MLFLTLGTGVGGGIVTEGDLVNGTNSFRRRGWPHDGEPFSRRPPLHLGRRTVHLEAYGSASALSRQLRRSV